MTYLQLNFFIILVPLLLSFESRIRYVQYWPAVLFSILTVGLMYVLWDAYVTNRGDWFFNPDYLSGVKLVNLPVEEVLFFITAPFSCIFIYEALKYLTPAFTVPFSVLCYLTAGFISLFAAWLFRYQNYTRTVMTVVGVTVIVLALRAGMMLSSGHYWLAILVSFIPFIIFNGYLTSIPIVKYKPEAITGIRIRTIPLEDFFYNYAMLSSYFWIYLLAKNAFSL